MQLSCCTATHKFLEAQGVRQVPLNRAAYLLLILRCNHRFHQPPTGVATRSGSGADGISVSAIAASFGQPFETARRHANDLIRQGICVRRGLRIRIPRQQFETAAFAQYLTDLHDIMVRFVQQLRDNGIDLPAVRAGIPYDRDATIAAALDLTLAAYEYGAPHFSSWLEMRVMCAVICANARADGSDEDAMSPEIRAIAESTDAPPRPVSTRAIARVLNISEATARRQLRSALDRGMVVRSNAGVVRSGQALEMPALIELPASASVDAIRTIQRLGSNGFHLNDPASHYLGPVPPLVDFD